MKNLNLITAALMIMTLISAYQVMTELSTTQRSVQSIVSYNLNK